MKIQIKPLALAWILVAAAPIVANAQSPHEVHGHAMPNSESAPQRGPNGGTMKQSDGLQLETVVSQSGIKIFVFDRLGKPVSVQRGRGTASLRAEGDAKRYRYDLMPDGKGALIAPVNLSRMAGRQIEIEIQLVGLPGTGNRPRTIHEVATVAASQHQLTAAGEQTRPGVFKVTADDKPFITAQKKCPVMDEPLDAMGGPYRVNANGNAIYICCPGCAKKIAAEPQRYLDILAQQGVKPPALKTQSTAASVPAGRDPVRPGVFKVTSADAPFIAAQKKCPVMDEPLDAMGEPYMVSAHGKAIYICCPGCAKKIAADPEKYLTVLAGQGINAPVIR